MVQLRLIAENAASRTGSREKQASHPGVANAVALVGLAILVCLFFYKTTIFGQPISKIDQLYQVDSLFNTQAIKAPRAEPDIDPSSYRLFFPTSHFVESVYRDFQLPLWNPLNGCGFPLIGDLQSHLFSPFHLLSVYSSLRAYDLYIVLKIALAALATFALGRLLGISILGSCLASTAFALSPSLLHVGHLESQEYLLPGVDLAFVWLARKPTAARAAATGLVCTLAIATMHPEFAFFAVAGGALLSLALLTIKPGLPLPARLLTWLKVISVTALVAFLTAAPLLFPFVELLQNCFFYKETWKGEVRPLAALHNYLKGAFLASERNAPFMGALAIPLIPLAFLRPSATTKAVLAVWGLALLFCMRFGWLAQLLSVKPFNYLNAFYGCSELLLLSALCAGAGLDRLTQFSGKATGRGRLVLFAIAVAAVLLGTLADGSAGVSGGALVAGGASLVWQYIKEHQLRMIAVWLVASLSIALACLAKPLNRLHPATLAVVLVALNFFSIALISRRSLPVQESFNMNPPDAVRYLQEHDGRCLAAGEHFFLPNTNLLFKVMDCRNFNPFSARRYREFFDSHDFWHCQVQSLNVPERLDHLVDLASVKYVATRDILTSVDDSEWSSGCVPLTVRSTGRIAFGLRLQKASIYYDTINSQADGQLLLRVHGYASGRYALQYVLLDSRSRPVWSGPQQMVSSKQAGQHLTIWPVNVPIPLSVEDGAELYLDFKVYDSWTGKFLEPDGKKVTATGACIQLARFTIKRAMPTAQGAGTQPATGPAAGQTSAAPDRHFVLAEETKNGMRVYKNLKAVPAAYVIFEPLCVHSREEALNMIRRLAFDARSQAVLELPENAPDQPTSTASSSFTAQANLERPNPTTVRVRTDSPKEGFLILTDLMYPGWKAYVDGSKTDIFYANYIFRAVRLPAGRHVVEFKFMPDSFLAGLALAACGILITMALTISSLMRTLKRRSLGT